MIDRESILPLALGLVVSLGLHIGAATGYIIAFGDLDAATEASADLPDLTVHKMAVGSPRLAGQPVRITATMQNIGTRPASTFGVACFVDDQPIGAAPVPGELAVYAADVHTFEYTATEPGVHSVKIVVDPDNEIAEVNEFNNQLQQWHIWVSPDAAQPDLTVSAITVSQPRVAGQPATVRVRAGNLGQTLNEPTKIKLWIDDEPVAAPTVEPPFDAGQWRTYKSQVVVDEPGRHTVKAVIDPDQGIDEADERNNMREASFVWTDSHLRFGVDKSDIVTMNWVGYDEFERLLAAKERFEQAALQKDIEPDPAAAQMPPDPTPPARRAATPSAAAAATPKQVAMLDAPSVQPLEPLNKTSPTLEQAPPLPDLVAPQASAPHEGPLAPPVEARPAGRPRLATLDVPPRPDADPELPKPVTGPMRDDIDRARPTDQPAPADQPDVMPTPGVGDQLRPPQVAALPIEPDPTALPAAPPPTNDVPPTDSAQTQRPDRPVDPDQPPTDTPRPAVLTTPIKPAKPNPAQTGTPDARPTAAPKSDAEADPVTLAESLIVRPGRVLVAKGLTVKTTRLRMSPVAMRTSIPCQAIVELTFDKAGRVVNARIIRSTGYANWDAPLLAAVYRWRASGELLEKAPGRITRRITITFSGRR